MTARLVSPLIIVATVVTLGLLALRQRRTHLLVTVEGHSMSPTYADGDRLLVRRVGLAAVHPGDVVVLDGGRPVEASIGLIIKRAAGVPGDPVPVGIPVADRLVPPGRLVVLGDNPSMSYDSRLAGYFDASAVIGVVIRSLGKQ